MCKKIYKCTNVSLLVTLFTENAQTALIVTLKPEKDLARLELYFSFNFYFTLLG